jgi:hypothetical protein
MSFSEHLPRVSPGQYPDEALLAEVGRALRGHLRRTGMWDQPPEFLGYPAYARWHDAFADGDAAAEPTLDCYLEAIVRRYGSLMDHLLTRKANVDGLVHLNIRRFILKRQKGHDPVGYAVFKNVEAVLAELIDEGAVRPVPPDPTGSGSLRNDTVLTFGEAAEDVPAPRDRVEAAAAAGPGWEQALPRLSKVGKGARRLLRPCLTGLPAAGVGTFRLRDLVGPLKVRARAVHAQRNRPADQEVVSVARGDDAVRELIRIVRPQAGYGEHQETLERLLDCVQKGIARRDFQERTREGLRRLVRELRQHADSDEEVPSWAELARQLGARRTTVWDHLVRLRELVRGCRDGK